MVETMKEICKRLLLVFLLSASVLSLNIVPISAINTIPGSTSRLPPEFTGNKIDIYEGPEYVELPANEPCYIDHGLGFPNWSNASMREKLNFMSSKAVFLLGVDYVLTELDIYYEYNRNEDIMWKMFYIQFPEGYFQGEHTFTGVWLDKIDYELFARTVIVNFT